MSAPAPHDYPAWTLYTYASDTSMRRIYCGHLLYVHFHEGQGWWCWHAPRLGLPLIYGFTSREAAQQDAERWAEAQP